MQGVALANRDIDAAFCAGFKLALVERPHSHCHLSRSPGTFASWIFPQQTWQLCS